MNEEKQMNGSLVRLGRFVGLLAFVILMPAICLLFFGSIFSTAPTRADDPAGSVIINAGDDYAASIQVTLTLQAPFTAEQMHLSHDGSSWEPWEDFAATRDWTLQSGDGEKAVYGQFYDGSQFSDVYSDTIVLDTTPPTVTVEIAAGAYAVNTTTVTATVAGSDATSGMNTLEWSDDGSTWVDAAPFVAGTYARTLVTSTYDGPDFFGPHVTYAVGSAPSSVAMGDLDGDRHPDLITANSDDNISVLLNQGDGTFAGRADYNVGRYPSSVAAGDLDGDSDLDLVAANGYSDNVSVLLNQGDGTFAGRADYNVGSRPLSVAMGDLDGDGDLDLVTASNVENNVSVLLNEGDGTFAGQVTYGVGSYPGSVAVGNLDGDGHLDLVTANHSVHNASVLLNQGDGTFAGRVDYNVGNYPSSVAMGDLDGDGDLDLAIANEGCGVSMLFNQGDGTFADRQDYCLGFKARHFVAVGDLDGNGHLDLVMTNSYPYDDSISVLFNRGDGSFARVEYGVGDNPVSVAVGDLDGDGDLDLAVANYYGDSVSVLLNHLVPPLQPAALYVRATDYAGWSTVYSDTVYVDTAPPWGASLLIADGADYTAQREVGFTLTAHDQLGPDYIKMAFRDAGGSFDDWVAYSTTYPWTLPASEGAKTVEAKYRDVAGNVSDVVSDTITLDQTPPAGSTVSINDGAETAMQITVTLTLTGTDGLSGVSQMRFSADGVSWDAWGTFATIHTRVLSSTDGLQTVYMQLRDTAGNVATAVSDTITVEVNPPLGEVVINDGATWTNQVTVTLTLTATDAGSGVTKMRLREAGGVWGSWIAYTAAYSFTLSGGDGAKTVEVQYEDGYGRQTDTLDDSIVLDTAPPSSSVADLPSYQSTLSFPVSWSGSDTASGIASYDVQFRDGTGISWEDWQIDVVATSTVFVGEDGHTYYFQSRARDNAGNIEAYPGGDGDAHVCVLLGDFDPNGQINVADIMEVASRWRMTDEDPGWDPRYDLNGDGIITVVDIMLVSARWGETCP